MSATTACPICSASITIDSRLTRRECGHAVLVTAAGILVSSANLDRTLPLLERIARDIGARYPVADSGLPLAERMAADERTLRAVLRERSARQCAALEESHA